MHGVIFSIPFSSVQFSHSVVSNSLQPHGLQHARPPCLSSTPGVYSNTCPLSPWCHPTISSSVVPFSSCLWSFPAPGSFPLSQLFTSGGQSIGFSACTSVLPMNIQNVVHWRREWQTTSVFLPWEPREQFNRLSVTHGNVSTLKEREKWTNWGV